MGQFVQKDDEAQLDEVDPRLANLLRAVVAALPFDCFVVRGRSSQADQQALYAIGRNVERWRTPVTDLDGVTKFSQHQKGLALDMAPVAVLQHGRWVDTYATDTLFNQIGLMAEETAAGLELDAYRWGGRFKKPRPDKPHHELTHA